MSIRPHLFSNIQPVQSSYPSSSIKMPPSEVTKAHPKPDGVPRRRRKKRLRGEKPKTRKVVQAGEQPSERRLQNGGFQRFDMVPRHTDALPRRARELMKTIEQVRAGNKRSGKDSIESVEMEVGKGLKAVVQDGKGKTKVKGVAHMTKEGKKDPKIDGIANAKSKGSEKGLNGGKFSAMQPGESFAQFSARLRKESKEMMVQLGRKGNHQREKKKAFHERRRARMEKKKKRRRGELGSDEEEMQEGNEEEESISHLPMYWQEIVKNNGKPLSCRKRKRLDRLERERETKDEVSFGVQVERPPDFEAVPVRRSKGRGGENGMVNE